MGAKVLVIGGGGREHAIAWKLRQSRQVSRVYCAPGNPGMKGTARLVPDASDAPAWVEFCDREKIDLVVVGPEQPLVDGAADSLRAAGIAVFGPGAEAARLEGDKGFAKEFMAAAGIPAAASQEFDALEPALAAARGVDGRCVVKACGLAAGKGVFVCDDMEQAEAGLRACLEEAAFGESGARVLVEERLVGPELSVFGVLDGERCALFMPSRDHKRLGEGDAGPNTGGMGAYTPVPDATPELVARIEEEVFRPALAELQRRDLEYRGLLYAGLMLTAGGPKVLEFNCRFGDPETQVVLPTYPGDLYELLAGAAAGQLPETGMLPRVGSAVGIVLASAGYPASSTKGVPIPGLDQLDREALVFHAATARREGDDDASFETAGGRVLCAVGRAEKLAPARDEALRLAKALQFEGAQWRRDIASSAREEGA